MIVGKGFVLLFWFFISSVSAGQAIPESISVTDGNAELTIFTNGDVNNANANLVINGEDFAQQMWVWYRKDDQDREHRLPPPDSAEAISSRGIRFHWFDFDGALDMIWQVYIYNYEQSVHVGQNHIIAPFSGTDSVYRFYYYSDYDADATSEDDNVSLVTQHPNFPRFRIHEGNHSIDVASYAYNSNSAGLSEVVLAALDDDTIVDISDLKSTGAGDYSMVVESRPILSNTRGNHNILVNNVYLTRNIRDWVDCEADQVTVTDLLTNQMYR